MARAPIPYFGGKMREVSKILPYFCEHECYVEPFGGAASLLLAKAPSPVEVYNDLDEHLVALFRVLADERRFLDFYRAVALLPYSRSVYEDAVAHMEAGTWFDELDHAVLTYIWARQSFSFRQPGPWAYGRKPPAKRTSGWLNAPRYLPAIHERLRSVQIECAPAIEIIKRFDGPATLFYCDPPYDPETRPASQGAYRHEYTSAQHEQLVGVLLQIEGHCVLSGYASEIYGPLKDAGWHIRTHKTHTQVLAGRGAQKIFPRQECLWLNYRPRDEKGRFI